MSLQSNSVYKPLINQPHPRTDSTPEIRSFFMTFSSTAFSAFQPLATTFSIRPVPISRRPFHTLVATMTTSTMNAVFMNRYGSPDQVLQYTQVPKPQLKDENHVLIRVHASSVHGGERFAIRGAPFYIRPAFGGLCRPTKNIPGSDVAGVIEQIGQQVTQLKVGDRVFGDVSMLNWGAWAQYISIPADAVIKLPTTVSMQHAAVTSVSAIPALQAVRDFAKVKQGDAVLVNGASGGVGHFAVQIAKSLGAHVSAVCHGDKMEMVRKCGADHVIDYTKRDVVKEGVVYDAVIDTAAFGSAWEMLDVVKKGGYYVCVGGDIGRLLETAIWGGWMSWRSGVNVKVLETKVNRESLGVIGDMLSDGRIVPHIDGKFELKDVAKAVKRLEERTVEGKVLLQIHD